MSEFEKLRLEYNTLVRVYNMAHKQYSIETDPQVKKEYLLDLQLCYEFILLKKAKLDKLKKQKVISKHVEYKDPEKKYYYASVYHPFLSKNDFKHITTRNYCSYDDIKDVYDEGVTRQVKGLFGYHDKVYYVKTSFPIIVEKDGNKIYDLITGNELMEFKYEHGSKKQFRYKGGICFSDEKYVTDKMVVELKGEIPKVVLADLLKKLDYVGKQNYISKMNEMQDIAKKAYYDHCNFKHDYQASHESDDTIIDTYRGSRSRKK